MSRYPTIYAGQRITGTLLQSTIADEYYKVTNTDRTSTTTFADDPDLTTTLEANAVYRVAFYLHYAAMAAAGFKTLWTVPAGASGNRSAIGPEQGVTLALTSGSGGTGRLGVHAYATTVTYGTRDHATNQAWALEESIITTSSAGTLAVQWAQATSNATATRLAAGSSLVVRRLA
ncbi:hypothetical protein [Streptomyces shenzhenensis]|uniref:hypothetical protein n=1 Tax=Streptomyces shenzhenensis TaxID=943815 RepID=UPI0036AA8427